MRRGRVVVSAARRRGGGLPAQLHELRAQRSVRAADILELNHCRRELVLKGTDAPLPDAPASSCGVLGCVNCALLWGRINGQRWLPWHNALHDSFNLTHEVCLRVLWQLHDSADVHLACFGLHGSTEQELQNRLQFFVACDGEIGRQSVE